MVVGPVVVTVVPSPKLHWYCVMVPRGDEEAEPSRETVILFVDTTNEAIGDWSGVMAMPRGVALSVSISSMGDMGVFVRSKTEISRALSHVTYASFPSGVMAMF